MTLKEGFLTGFSFEGGTNGDTFLWFVENVLVPCLWTGAVVVMGGMAKQPLFSDKSCL